jgi:hypothetical protein
VGVSSTYGITAKRVDYVTDAFKNLSDPPSVMQAAQTKVVGTLNEDGVAQGGLFAFGNGSLGAQGPWAALYRPTDFPVLDCISLSTITAAQLEQVGVNAYASYAYATTNLYGFATKAFDATFGKTINDQSGNPYQWLDWYLADGTVPQAFEGYVYLCAGGTATKAYTLAPLDGPFATLPQDTTNLEDKCPDPIPGVPSTPERPKRLALSVIFNTLKTQQDGATPPRGGRQWWVDASLTPVGSVAVPFPIQGQGVQ